jgi:hypothetical protein
MTMAGSTIVLDPYVVLVPKSTAESAGTSVVHAIWQAEVVADRTCTFVMFSGDGAPVLVPLTTPAQPFSPSTAKIGSKIQT